MWHEFSPKNPFRPVNWRWERAGIAVESGFRLSRTRDDRWTERAFRFREQQRECTSPTDFWRLSEDFPDVYYAHAFWGAREDDDRSLMTHEIEARVLARVEAADVAVRFGVDPGVIDAYEALFFDVRPRLDNKSYVLHHVFGKAIQGGVRERQFDLIWKLFAYGGGPRVLDLMVSTMPEIGWPETADEVSAWLRDAFKGQLTRKAMIAVQTMSASDSFTQGEILTSYLKLVEVEAHVDVGGKGQATMLNNVQAMLDHLPFAVAGQTPKNFAAPGLADDYADSAAEPRGDEAILLALGESPRGMDRVRVLQFPALPDLVQRTVDQEGVTQ